MTGQYFFNNPVFRLAAPAVFGLLLYLLILLVNNNVQQINGIFITQELYVVIVLTYLAFEALRAAILLNNKILKTGSSALRVITQLLTSTSLSVALVLFGLMVYFKYVIGFSMSGTQLTIFGVTFAITAVLYNVMYFSHYFLHKENAIKLHTEKQQRMVLEMEMMEYRADINPDLLYESLENLIGIMYKDVGRAEDYIDCLASAYRYVLTNRENEMVTIREELDACRNILQLLNEKYAGRLVLECSLQEEETDAMLIPGSLPVTMEYLVRNSIISTGDPFLIRLFMEEEYLTLETRLNDRLILHEPSEQAFARLQRSYALYTELPLIRVKAYEQNYVKLPVLRVREDIGVIE